MKRCFLACAAVVLLAGRSSIARADGPVVVDLLKLVDVKKASLSGAWKMENGKLSCDVANGFARLEFPYCPPDEYDFQIVFTRTDGNLEVCSVAAAAGHQFAWTVGGWRNRISGFELIDGKRANVNATKTVSSNVIVNNQTYTSLIKVRNDHVEGYLNGVLISSLKTDYSNMSIFPPERLARGDTLGISACHDAISIESAQVTEISGQGKILPSAVQVAAAVPAPSPVAVPAPVVTAPATPPPTMAPAPTPASAPVVAAAPASAVIPPPAPTVKPVIRTNTYATPEEIRAMMAGGQFKDANVAITRLLSPSGPAETYDRHEMMLLRAECLLQLHQGMTALELLGGIRKESAANADLKGASEAGAMAFLLRNAPGGFYTPKLATDKTPVSILGITDRKAVYSELFDDQFAMCEKRARDALLGSSLVPIIQIGNNFESVEDLERFNTGSIRQCSPIAKDLVTAGVKLMDTELDRMNYTIIRINRDASRLVRNAIGDQDGGRGYHRAGASHPEMVTLEQIASDCQRIQQTCSDFIDQFGVDPDALKKEAFRAGAMGERAEAVAAGNEDPAGTDPGSSANTNVPGRRGRGGISTAGQ